MPEFQYVARDQSGQTVSGKLFADSKEQLYTQLREDNYFVVSSKPIAEKTRTVKGRRIRRRELINFTIQLSNILGAGIPLNLGLSDVASVADQDWFRELVLEVKNSIEVDGLSLSEALARHPKTFSPVYVSVVRAGETTGNVENCLEDLATFLEWQDKLIKDIRQATFYPAVILTSVIILSILLLTFVFPKFMVILSQLQTSELPLPTRILMATSDFLVNVGIYLLMAVVILMIVAAIAVRQSSSARLAWDRFKLSLPIVGELVRKIALSRFANYFGMLSRAGVDVITSLKIVEEVIGNAVLARVVMTARNQVLGGSTLSEALALSKEIPPLVIRMLHLGETTGEIDTSLMRMKDFYDREVARGVSRIFAVMEPVLFILLASVILIMALAMYLPMWSILDQI